MMRSSITHTRTLHTSADVVWHLITDTQTWPRWGPSVRSVDFPERYIDAGATGRICTPFGLWLPFAIHTFDPPIYWDWKVGGIMATGHGVQAIGPDRCRLTFSVPAWGVGYGVVCRAALSRIERLLEQA
jgi:hypothetical protein